MGFLKRRRKSKDKKLKFAPKSTESDVLGEYIRTMEAHFGFHAVQEIKFQTKMRKQALKLARKRQKRGLNYRV